MAKTKSRTPLEAAPEPEYHAYQFDPIDFWAGWPHLEDLGSDLFNTWLNGDQISDDARERAGRDVAELVRHLIGSVAHLAKRTRWEGDIVELRLMPIPDRPTQPAVVVKQDSNGNVFVVATERLQDAFGWRHKLLEPKPLPNGPHRATTAG